MIETSQPGNIIVITSSGEDKLVYLELSAAAEDATMHELKIEKPILITPRQTNLS